MTVKTARFALALTVLSVIGSGCTAQYVQSGTSEALVEAPDVSAELPGEQSPWIAADFDVPVVAETGNFVLVPLGPELVEIDFQAYMSSIEHLQQTFTRSTRWPREGITAAEAMQDMETEEARFKARESFAFAVLTPDRSRERGSVYVYPSTVAGYDAVVTMWVTKSDYDAGFDAELYAWVTGWIEKDWPFESVAYPGRATDWDTWDRLTAPSSDE